MSYRYDVVAIGNAIVDVLARVEDSFIEAHDLTKGSMALIEEAQAEALYQALPPATEKSGGSAANTLAGIASFGAKTAFIGKVANDQLGAIFSHDLRSIGVDFETAPLANGPKTARSMIAITPDAQRTMSTFLGAASHITPQDIDESLITNSKVIYFEGYLWDQSAAKDAMVKAMKAARAADIDVAFSLSDSFCVERHREEFKVLLRDYITVLFCNEDEAMSLCETDDFEVCKSHIRELCPLVTITRGDKGAVIFHKKETIQVPAKDNLTLVDTTGAGDLYAAGFLYGYTQGYSLLQSGRLAVEAASEIIQHVGARPEITLSTVLGAIDAA